MKFFFKLILKVSAFYFEKQESFIPKKKILGHCQYQNKKALFTDSIFQKVLIRMKKSRTCGHSVISMEFLPNFPHSFFRQISLNLPTSFAKVIFPLFSSYFDNNSYGNFSQNKKRHDARQRLFITYHISPKKDRYFFCPPK